MEDVVSAVETLRSLALRAPLLVLPGVALLVLIALAVRGYRRERRQEVLWRDE